VPGNQLDETVKLGFYRHLREGFVPPDRNVQGLARSNPLLYVIQPPGAAESQEFFGIHECFERNCGLHAGFRQQRERFSFCHCFFGSAETR